MYSETLDIIPFTSPFKSELLTQAELETLKGGTLHLLDEVGVHFPSRRALEIFADHGARVDMETEIVRIPPDLVQKAMSTAPRSRCPMSPTPVRDSDRPPRASGASGSAARRRRAPRRRAQAECGGIQEQRLLVFSSARLLV